jgi:hypothetical protein
MVLFLFGCCKLECISLLERTLQKLIVAHLKSMGYLCHKVDSSSSVGFPDLVAVSPAGKVFFFEVKTQTGRLSRLQERVINQLKENHANVHVVRSVEEVRAIVSQDEL